MHSHLFICIHFIIRRIDSVQKIIPFKKEAHFKENVSEITSISLEHTLHKEKDNLITGEFLVSGEYKVVDTSSVIDHFSFHLPFDIHMDDKYNIANTEVDIDDFYYEIINSDTLLVNIDVLMDKVEEKVVEPVEELELVRESEEELSIEREDEMLEDTILEDMKIEPNTQFSFTNEREETVLDTIREESTIDTVSASLNHEREEISSIFDDMGSAVGASATYRIYIVREEDTLESIMNKYTISKEHLEKYNNLKEVKKGDKLIIPCMYSEKI